MSLPANQPPSPHSKSLIPVLLALAILGLNLALCGPLFVPGELPFRGSIEDGYVGTARFLSQHPNPWGWDPLPYCGLPTQFVYVPLLPYLSAAGMHLFSSAAPDTVYRTLAALFTCLGPVTLFFFALHFTGSRRWAFAMAVAYSLLSPSYGLFPAVEKDRGIVQLPWRVQVLAKYGEGPHNTGLTLLPLALLALWRAGRTEAGRARTRRILLAALLLAAIPLTNWVAAFALAISCLLLWLAAWGEREFRTWPALASAAIAYLLACFWLTPSFVKTIVFNWPVDSFGYQLHSQQVALLASAAAGAVIIRLLFGWRGGSFYLCFATMGAFVFGLIATAFYVYNVDTIPESRRYAIEFELFLALALFEVFRLALRSANGTVRLCAIGTGGVMLLVGVPQLWAEATQGWRPWLPVPPEQTVEYQLGKWMADHPPQGRVLATGGLRFRLNSWFHLQQVGGGFETGLQNRIPLELAYRIRTAAHLHPGHETEETLLDLKALGAEYVVLHGPKSREYYRDFLKPERVSYTLPIAYHVEDDTIYRLPSRPIAHLVRADELAGDDLSRYVAALEDGARPVLAVRWADASTVEVTGAVPEGNLISVQVNADPGWRATQDGQSIPVSQDGIGFVVLHPRAAPSARIELRYHGTAEQRIMAGLCGLAWLGVLVTFFRSRAEVR
ncbi:MAG TPA: hypothetical protein VKU19_02595 [Bryobacteraceae bacterium]|nr:hypothetical protein [Bryobacteraceae bacterium]